MSRKNKGGTNMEKMDLLIKRISPDFDDVEKNISLKLCNNFIDKWRYTKVFVKSFNKPFISYLIVFMNCYGYKEDLYLAYLDSKLIGCFTLRSKSRRMMYLYDFALLPLYRGKGYSRDLLQCIYRICELENKKKLCLYLKRNNYVAKNLYFSEGFQVSN